MFSSIFGVASDVFPACSLLVGPEGRVAVVDWVGQESFFGPPVEHRLEQSSVEQLLTGKGLRLGGSRPIGEDLYALVAVLDNSAAAWKGAEGGSTNGFFPPQ
jgi:hypothetical protein